MRAIYYARKRETGFHEKPGLAKVFAFLDELYQKEIAVKTLFLEPEEYTEIETDIRSLAADINFYKLNNPQVGVARVIGVPFEILDSVTTQMNIKGRRLDKED